MKGVALPIETIVIISLAIIVLVALLMFFTGIFGPSAELVKLKSEQSTWCSSYHQSNPNCDEDGHNNNVGDDIKKALARICTRLNSLEGGYPACIYGEDEPAGLACAQECCKMFCGEPVESPTTTTTA